MTLSELNEILCATQYPVAYQVFPEQTRVKLPFITYDVAYSNNFGADGVVYKPIGHVEVNLYIDNNADPRPAQQTLEQALDFTYWSKESDYLDDEKILLITYEFDIIGGN